MKNTNHAFIGYIDIHLVITFILGYFVLGAEKIIDYIIIFIGIEVLWILNILIDIQGRVSINTHLIEESTKNKK